MTAPHVPLRIIAQVAFRHRLTSADITGPSIAPHVYRARVQAIVKVKAATGLSCERLGGLFNRDRRNIWGALQDAKAWALAEQVRA